MKRILNTDAKKKIRYINVKPDFNLKFYLLFTETQPLVLWATENLAVVGLVMIKETKSKILKFKYLVLT